MKTALLTGASRGLGWVIARQLLEQGWRIVTVQRHVSEPLNELKQQFPDRLTTFKFDLANIHDIDERFRFDWFPDDAPVHGLVNNAASAYDDLVTNLDSDTFRAMWSLNVESPMLLTKLTIRRMLLHQIPGSIVHLSSVAAHKGFKGLAMYGATKGAIESFSRGVAREWGGRQIRSNCVVPGFMETDMSGGLSEEMRNRIYQRTALKSPTDPASVAASVGFLLSDLSRSITGQNLFVDCGNH